MTWGGGKRLVNIKYRYRSGPFSLPNAATTRVHDWVHPCLCNWAYRRFRIQVNSPTGRRRPRGEVGHGEKAPTGRSHPRGEVAHGEKSPTGRSRPRGEVAHGEKSPTGRSRPRGEVAHGEKSPTGRSRPRGEVALGEKSPTGRSLGMSSRVCVTG